MTYSGATATLDPDADLAPSTTYEVTVDGDVEDANGNSLGADDTWLFTTASAVSFSLTDTLVTAEFGAGTTGPDTYVSETANGEVTLKPTVGAEFSGTALPAGWSSCTWPRRRQLPAALPEGPPSRGGSLHVDGGLAGHQRHLQLRSRARVRRDLRRRDASSTSGSRTISTTSFAIFSTSGRPASSKPAPPSAAM